MLYGRAGGIHMDKQTLLGPSLALRLTDSAWLMPHTTKISYISPRDFPKQHPCLGCLWARASPEPQLGAVVGGTRRAHTSSLTVRTGATYRAVTLFRTLTQCDLPRVPRLLVLICVTAREGRVQIRNADRTDKGFIATPSLKSMVSFHSCLVTSTMR